MSHVGIVKPTKEQVSGILADKARLESICKRAFELNDQEKKGYLSRKHFEKIMTHVCRVMEWDSDFTPQEKDDWFSAIDDSGEGKIELDEFSFLIEYILQHIESQLNA
mmetsp:Transcript_36091/g.32476  ORF Transcript_36091/g.32476 Transcript_36091/m.32476 type:complete len:108 (-) Transcript_36091:164-487(-)